MDNLHQTAPEGHEKVLSGEFGQMGPVQTSTAAASAPPPDANGYQTAANSSHQVTQLMRYKSAASPSLPPIQRALTGELSDASQINTQADQAAFDRYTERKDETQKAINGTPNHGSAASVSALVFSGNFGLLASIPVPDPQGADPYTDHAYDRASGQTPRFPSHDGEMYLIDAMDEIVKQYLGDHGQGLRPLHYNSRSKQFVANTDPLHDEIRVEIVGPKGTCTDCQAALRSWLVDKMLDFQYYTKYPKDLTEKNFDWTNFGEAGSIEISLVTRWTDGQQVRNNVRMDTQSQSHTYGSAQATQKDRTLKGSGEDATQSHHKLKFESQSTSPPTRPSKPEKKVNKRNQNAFAALMVEQGESESEEESVPEKSSVPSSSQGRGGKKKKKNKGKQSKSTDSAASVAAPTASNENADAGDGAWQWSDYCYLTTACVSERGLPDDCPELTALRSFRDNYLYQQPHGPALIKKYYTYAPNIVQSINARPDRSSVYGEIYAVIRRCVGLIEAGELEATFDLYCEMVEEVREKYAGAVLVL